MLKGSFKVCMYGILLVSKVINIWTVLSAIYQIMYVAFNSMFSFLMSILLFVFVCRVVYNIVFFLMRLFSVYDRR